LRSIILKEGNAERSLLRRYAINRKVAGPITDEVIGFFKKLIISAALGPEVDSASNRNEYQEYSGDK
jgi:hypothetical protein